MRPDTKECCPYTTSDCSYRTLDDEEATFYVLFSLSLFKKKENKTKNFGKNRKKKRFIFTGLQYQRTDILQVAV